MFYANLIILGANSPGLWQSQLAAVAARQLTSQQNNTPESRGPTPGAVGPQLPLPPNLPPPPSPLAVATSAAAAAAAPTQSPQISPNEITAIQNALQHQQQNIFNSICKIYSYSNSRLTHLETLRLQLTIMYLLLPLWEIR